jgi:hypothetical protein
MATAMQPLSPGSWVSAPVERVAAERHDGGAEEGADVDVLAVGADGDDARAVEPSGVRASRPRVLRDAAGGARQLGQRAGARVAPEDGE